MGPLLNTNLLFGLLKQGRYEVQNQKGFSSHLKTLLRKRLLKYSAINHKKNVKNHHI